MINNYNEQLEYLRNAGMAFAKQHPKAAQHLSIDSHGVGDPLLERLLSSFAFLTAKIQSNQQQDMQRLVKTLLNVLYPIAILPVPSVGVAEFMPNKDFKQIKPITADHELVNINDEAKNFRLKLNSDVNVLPLSLTKEYLKPIIDIPESINYPKNTRSFLALNFKNLSEEFEAQSINQNGLPLYIDTNQQYIYLIVNYLLNHCLGMCAMNEEGMQTPLFTHVFENVAFKSDNLILPKVNSGYEYNQIFSEFCMFQEKSMFVQMNHFKDIAEYLNTLDFTMYLFFDKTCTEINKSKIKLNCVSAVNLFNLPSKPIQTDAQKHDYLIEPNFNHLNKIEIYKINKMESWSNKQDIQCKPIYYNQVLKSDQPTIYWDTYKTSSWELGSESLEGCETFVSLNMNDIETKRNYINADLLVMNRDYQQLNQFFYGGVDVKINGYIHQDMSIQMINTCTPIYRPYEYQSLNDLLRLLTQSFYAFLNEVDSNDNNNLDILKNTLHALNRTDNELVFNAINSFKKLSIEKPILRYPSKHLIYVKGIVLNLEVYVEDQYNDYFSLFVQALNHFVKQFCPINSFIQLKIVNISNNEEILCQPHFC